VERKSRKGATKKETTTEEGGKTLLCFCVEEAVGREEAGGEVNLEYLHVCGGDIG